LADSKANLADQVNILVECHSPSILVTLIILTVVGGFSNCTLNFTIVFSIVNQDMAAKASFIDHFLRKPWVFDVFILLLVDPNIDPNS
jgi:hypothetical protein